MQIYYKIQPLLSGVTLGDLRLGPPHMVAMVAKFSELFSIQTLYEVVILNSLSLHC